MVTIDDKLMKKIEEYRQRYWASEETSNPEIEEYRQKSFNYIAAGMVFEETLRKEYDVLPVVCESAGFFNYGDCMNNLLQDLRCISGGMDEFEWATPERFEETIGLIERYAKLIERYPDFRKAEFACAPTFFPEYSEYQRRALKQDEGIDTTRLYLDYAEPRLKAME